jgi:hypothetical protein
MFNIVIVFNVVMASLASTYYSLENIHSKSEVISQFILLHF